MEQRIFFIKFASKKAVFGSAVRTRKMNIKKHKYKIINYMNFPFSKSDDERCLQKSLEISSFEIFTKLFFLSLNNF